jgi:hypothetical protein
MVNAGVVNAGALHVFFRLFARFSPLFAVFLRFQNPVKYIRGSRINHKRAAGNCARRCIYFTKSKRYTNAPRLTLPQSASAKLIQHRKAPRNRKKRGQTELTGG